MTTEVKDNAPKSDAPKSEVVRPHKRARVPTVLQMEALECGAATLAMVLAHYGRYVPLEELRVACGVSRDGSKASNMLKAARTYGLEAKGLRKEPEQLKQLQPPLILHWNFNHFVVFEGFGKDKVYLNDPAQGPTTVTEGEFDQAFTGVALSFAPTPEFKPGGAQRSLVKGLGPRLAGSHGGLLYVLAAGLALVIPGIVGPSFARIFVDDVLVHALDTWLRPLLIMMGITALVQLALTWLRQRYLLRLETKLALTMSTEFFWHVLRLPYDFFTQRYAGEIGNRVEINDKVARLLSGDLATTALNIIVIAFYALLMIQYDVVLTLVSIGIALMNIAALRYVSRKRTDLNKRLLQDQGKFMGVAMGGLQTLETLKASGSESDFFARWAGHQAKVVNTAQQMALTTNLLSAVPPLLLSINTALILGIGGMRVMEGNLSMGMLMAFQALMLAFINPVNRMVALGGTLQEVKGDLERLDDVLRAPAHNVSVSEPREETAEPVARVKFTGDLELKNVTFGYSRLAAPLISEFSLHLRSGSRVALVGGSGSGKSTIAKLVSGLYDPWDGEIRFDGELRASIPREVMTNSVAVVDQDIFLFENTVRENVSLWDTTIPEARVLQAARDACIHDDVAARLEGYGSLVEEGGRNFSGGQRQRLEIARALAINPTLLVLDEATSALDPTTEKMIDDNLRKRGCTCLLIAHRLSTIRDCDEIIVLDRGRVVQRGTHEEMCASKGPYTRLIAAE